jgi:hypothetical protein
MGLLVGHDLGTHANKAVLLDESGRVGEAVALALSTPSGAPACAVAPPSAASTRAGRLAPCAPAKA